MSLVKQIFNHFQQRFFDSVIRNRLIYNSCWEDPRIDRELLDIDSRSKVVMLTSAGCNALDYLLDDPASIHCADTNPAQSALLELKLALFAHGDHETLWNMFSGRQSHSADTWYRQELRDFLSPGAQHYWDHHINYFLPAASSPSFYFRGTSGTLANIVHRHIRHKGLYDSVLNLLDSKSLQEQRYYYEEIEPELWNWFSRWVISRNTTMAMLGVPDDQLAIIDNETQAGIATYIRNAIRDVFRNRPVHDNYFWRVYLTGNYTPDCCPNYLKEKYFDQIRDRRNRITVQTTSLADFLQKNPGNYSHFVLLDHQDWLASQHPDMLSEEWKLILGNAQPGAKILFRSAGISRSFIPEFVYDYVIFNDEETSSLHTKDRVGTYGSTHLATVTSAI